MRVCGICVAVCVWDGGRSNLWLSVNEVNNEVTLRKSSKERERGVNTVEDKHVHPLRQVKKQKEETYCMCL